MTLLGLEEILGDKIERRFPRDRFEGTLAFDAGPPQRLRQPIGMMDALGIASDLGADHACRVGIIGRAVYATDGALIENLDLERASRGAIMIDLLR